MDFHCRQVTEDDADFCQLTDELNQVLTKLTGDSGASSFTHAAITSQEAVQLVVYLGDQPVACGALRSHSSSIGELKRIYSKVSGGGSFVLERLLAIAKDLGFHQVILSTRLVNQNAVDFYLAKGFRPIAPFGKYRFSTLSICLGKTLSH